MKKEPGTPRHKPHDPARLRRHVPWLESLEVRRGKPPPPPTEQAPEPLDEGPTGETPRP
jgi:hypothetical protein